MENKKSIISLGVLYGLITAAVIAILALLFYFLEIKESYMMMILVLGVMVGGVFFGISGYKKKYPEHGMSFRGALLGGLVISVLAAFIVALANYFFFQVIDPNHIYKILQVSEGEYKSRFSSPVWMSFFIFMTYTIYGFLATFFIAFMLKEKPVK